MQPTGLRRFRDSLVIYSLVFALLLIFGWSFWKPVLTAMGSALVEDDGPGKMQAAVVLGGDQDCARIMKAASLAQAGYASFVMVSGPESFGVHECDLTVNYAEHKGYPPTLFRPYPNDSLSTESEVEGIGRNLRAQGITRILLVTSNFHTRRAARLFRRENPAMTVRVVPAPDRWFTPQTWWESREGRKTFLLEWAKTVASWFGS